MVVGMDLFTRLPDSISITKGFHLTVISADDEASSLSAILLDDDYYYFTLANTMLSEGLHHANDIALIVLKAKAFLNNRKRKEEGQDVQEQDIDKHRKDVIRLTVALDPQQRMEVPEVIKRDLRAYIETVKTENPDVKQLLKNLGVNNGSLELIFDQLTRTFKLDRI